MKASSILALICLAASLAYVTDAPPEDAVAETAAQAEKRHAQVAARRQQTIVLCHRGAQEFAHENTLEAYRATFELGGDGNEIDIRGTKDGVVVCFHEPRRLPWRMFPK